MSHLSEVKPLVTLGDIYVDMKVWSRMSVVTVQSVTVQQVYNLLVHSDYKQFCHFLCGKCFKCEFGLKRHFNKWHDWSAFICLCVHQWYFSEL